METSKFKIYSHQFQQTFRKHIHAWKFIKRNRLWEGLFHYGWVSKLLIFIAFILGIKFFFIGLSWVKNSGGNPMRAISNMGGMLQEFTLSSFNMMFYGSMKYVLLILLEVIIFHFSRMTVEKLTGKKGDVSLNVFLGAQLRMIKVAFRSWIAESVITAIIGALFFLSGPFAIIESSLIFGVHCYYLGFVILDNYNEQFGLSIKDSVKYSRQYLGVALASGLFLHLVMMVPVVGSIVGPVVASVAVTLVMFELSDLHLKGEKVMEPEPEELV